MKAFYIEFLGCSDYWMRFEWQHCGSPHIHGLSWLPNTPGVETINTSPETKLQLIKFIDSIISNVNPAIDMDGSNQSSAPMPHCYLPTPH